MPFCGCYHHLLISWKTAVLQLVAVLMAAVQAVALLCPLYYTSIWLSSVQNYAFTALIWIVCQAQSTGPQPVSGMQVADVITLLNHAAKEHGILHLTPSGNNTLV